MKLQLGLNKNLITGDSTSSTVLAELCGTSPSVQSFTSTGPSLTVRFESDDQTSPPQAGFYANVFTLGKFISISILV